MAVTQNNDGFPNLPVKASPIAADTAFIADSVTGLPAQALLTNFPFLQLAGGTMTGDLILNADPSVNLQAATKQYVDNIAAGFAVKAPVLVATTGNETVTYNNLGGPGDTLTNAGAQAALTIDGVALSVNDRVLFKDQTAQEENGIWFVTDIGSGATNWVVERATDYDTAAEITVGSLVIVQQGTANAVTSWLQTATVTTVGTDPIVFTQFSSGGGAVTSVSGTANRITSTGGTTPVIDISASYVGQASITTLGTVTTGVWNATVIDLAHGGTNKALTAADGGIVYTDANSMEVLAPTATALQMLQSGANTLPSWSSATYPATTTINQILYSSAANTVVGLATANDSVLITSAAGVPSLSQALPNGVTATTQTAGNNTTLVATTAFVTTAVGGAGTVTSVSGTANRITSTGGATPVIDISASYVGQASITTLGTVTTGVWNGTVVDVQHGGTGVATLSTAYGTLAAGTTATGPVQTIAPGTAGFVLTSNGSSALPTYQAATGNMVWSETTGTSDTLVVNRGFIANNAGLVTYTLPATAALGDRIVIMGKGAGGWKIAQGTNQQIHIGNQTTTLSSGSLASTNQWDNIELICITAGSSTIWSCRPPFGQITVV